MRDRRGWIVVCAAVLVAALLVGLVVWAYELRPSGSSSRNSPPPPSVFNVTFMDRSASLGDLFHPGVILGVATNSTATLLAGITAYNRSSGSELPVIARSEATGSTWENITSPLNTQFWYGGVYSAVFNGSSWLLGGQASWRGIDTGSAAFLTGSTLVNITPQLGAIFAGGGIFAVGWNGSSWLIGGNSSTGIGLAAVTGAYVTDLSPQVGTHVHAGWVQAIQWSGKEWMVMGEGVFGVLRGSQYIDLDPQSPFLDNGCFAAAWNGTAWLVGGGAGKTVLVQNDRVSAGPRMPAEFDQVVLFIANFGLGWIIAGKGLAANGSTMGEFVTWNGNTTGGVVDRSSDLPSAFSGGEIQAGAVLEQMSLNPGGPAYGASGGGGFSVILVGDGDYNYSSGAGTGAVAWAQVSPVGSN